MKNLITLFICICLSLSGFAQEKVSITGSVVDSAGVAMPSSTVSILYPEDSTLAYFGITNLEGNFTISNVKQGDYILQASYLGFSNTFWKISSADLSGDLDLGPIVLKLKAVNLDGVEITGTQAPILIKADTVEYNASSFRSKPTDNVENLLKKMPGIEVDRDGTIKAQGEEVKKVTVDGKEFFGNDPKMATKNLPADAVDKVQVFDKQSDAAEFTGVDDGERTKTINLKLKEDKKKGAFGEVRGGYGTNDRYEFAGSGFKFDKKLQLSAIGKLNNINDYGFSISDYLNFQTGGAGFGPGNMSFTFNSDDNSVPLNFGQNQYGNLVSGALGLNSSYEIRKGNDLSVSYMFNGSDRGTQTNSTSTQFTRQGEIQNTEDESKSDANYGHATNLRWKNDVDSLTRIIITGSANITDANSDLRSFRITQNGDQQSTLDRDLTSNSDGLVMNSNAKLIRKSASKIGRNVNGEVSLGLNQSLANTNWLNNTITPQNSEISENFFREDAQDSWNYQLSGAWNEPLFKNHFIEFEGSYLNRFSNIARDQELKQSEQNTQTVPSEFAEQIVSEAQAKVSWKITGDNTTFSAGLGVSGIEMENTYDQNSEEVDANTLNKSYLLPNFRLRHRFGQGRRLNLSYNTNVNYPNISRVAPLVDLSSPLSLNRGNLNLEPEYSHNGNLFFMIYDQFSFTSFFINARYTHTENSIVNARSFNPQTLVQEIEPVNFKDRQNMEVSVSFSTPIKKLGLMVNLGLDEGYSTGYSLIDGQENLLTSFSHGGDISISNRKKDKIEAELGFALNYTTSDYSINSAQNTNYLSQSLFADAAWYINDKWIISSSLDVTNYENSQFANAVQVPLWSAEITHNFLAGNKGSLRLKAFDLLNKNQGVEQFTSENYIGQQVSNILSQYFMLSFTYKFRKAGTEDPMSGFMKMHKMR
ncbi:TonB-dependent receptor [Luteibaculum oceani]|uniref:Outer membrane beta-barrel protein n=1 Tax=Luteibaculum oceani TaxID=1294296 RepID=A0A5C6UQE7_9FLAO|nr:TonB-dependent receptor [Luteibaculum oceani]TXC75563.1 outer membrane beta-barrel protein [Luteibaculum oceani]